MNPGAFRTEERYGLAVAVAAHVALVLLLVLRPPGHAIIPPPERMTVTLSDDVGLTSTSPQPAADAAPDVAPQIGEAPPPPQPVASPEPVEQAEPVPPPKAAPVQRPQARPSAAPPSKPVQRAQAQPATKPAVPTKRPGGSRVGADFLKGIPAAQTNGKAQTPPAAAIGPAVRSALSGAISRQLKPRWVAPQGVDADKLVTYLTWSLNADGTLAGAPRLVRQEGVNDANRPQAQRHVEQAIRAVQLAAPFQLPAEYYDAWKRIAEFRFDKRLSQ